MLHETVWGCRNPHVHGVPYNLDESGGVDQQPTKKFYNLVQRLGVSIMHVVIR